MRSTRSRALPKGARFSGVVWLLVAGSPTTSACGAVAAAEGRPRAGAVGVGEPVEAPHPQALPAEYVPAHPPSPAYGGPPTPPDDADPLVAKLRLRLSALAKKAGHPVPGSDGRLDRAATELARLGGPATHELVTFVSRAQGLPEPEPAVVAVGTNAPEGEAVALVAEQLATALTGSAWARVGVGVSRGPAGMQVVVLLSPMALELAPLPRSLPAAGGAPVAGRLPPGYEDVALVVTTPAGRVGRLPVQSKGRAFSGRFSCVEGPGRYEVELMASHKRGPEVMANVPVYCGVDAPDRLSLAKPHAFPAVTEPRAIEAAFVAAVNRERQARKLPALVADRRLADVARAHSEAMARRREVSHLSPQGEDAADRVRAAGLAPSLVAENVGAASTAAGAHEGFMASPAHRGNVLEPRASHLGVGVVEGTAPNGGAVYYVTTLFAAF
ncbi:MAG: CAP domain-containing protein [Myxococcales bacterium]|nr:CAP domain-containing protein [Myxococcales bacterium]